jgi:hypothetical protein
VGYLEIWFGSLSSIPRTQVRTKERPDIIELSSDFHTHCVKSTPTMCPHTIRNKPVYFLIYIIIIKSCIMQIKYKWDNLSQRQTIFERFKTERSRAWWLTPLIPALGRQRQADFWVRGQPGLQSEFQDSQGYTEKPCLEKTKTNKHTNKPSKQQQQTERNLAVWIPEMKQEFGGWGQIRNKRKSKDFDVRRENMRVRAICCKGQKWVISVAKKKTKWRIHLVNRELKFPSRALGCRAAKDPRRKMGNAEGVLKIASQIFTRAEAPTANRSIPCSIYIHETVRPSDRLGSVFPALTWDFTRPPMCESAGEVRPN